MHSSKIIITRLLQLKKRVPKERKAVKTADKFCYRAIPSQPLSNTRARNTTDRVETWLT